MLKREAIVKKIVDMERCLVFFQNQTGLGLTLKMQKGHHHQAGGPEEVIA